MRNWTNYDIRSGGYREEYADFLGPVRREDFRPLLPRSGMKIEEHPPLPSLDARRWKDAKAVIYSRVPKSGMCSKLTGFPLLLTPLNSGNRCSVRILVILLPLSGSTTMLKYIWELAMKNRFTVLALKQTRYFVWRSLNRYANRKVLCLHVKNALSEFPMYRTEEANVWCKHLDANSWKKNRTLFHGHTYFTDVESLECPDGIKLNAPVWINLVRDPLDRFGEYKMFISPLGMLEIGALESMCMHSLMQTMVRVRYQNSSGITLWNSTFGLNLWWKIGHRYFKV